jgi:hypothetical protein
MESGDFTQSKAPQIESVSHPLVVVGQTLEFYGRGLLADDKGRSYLYAEGQFTDTLGQSNNVDLTIFPVYGGKEIGDDGRDILTWSRVGPFKNPFTRDARNGLFRGTIRVINEYNDGMVEEGQSTPFNLEIGPSIMIDALQPIDADCGAPAVRILPGIPYMLRVKVSGLRANRFVYRINNVNGVEGVSTFEHTLNPGQVSQEDTVGEISEMIVFNQVPNDLQSYVSGIQIAAYDEDGYTVESALPIGVHRPMEIVYDGSVKLAERYEPIPVSGCIPGSIGNSVSYSESQTETRTQSVTVTVSSNWSNSDSRQVSQNTSEGITIGESSNRSFGQSLSERESLSEGFGETYNESESNQVNFASNDGESWSWNLSQGESQEDYESRNNSRFGEASGSVTVGVGGEGQVPGFAKVSGSVESTVGVSAGMSSGNASGTRQRTSTNRGYSMAGNSSESQSFGNALSESRSQSINGTYAMGRGNSASEMNSEGMNTARTWNLNEGTSVNNVVSQGNSESISNTVIQSTSKTVSQGFSGYIPQGRYGIFYRQTTRWVRQAQVRSYDLCGIAQHMGEVQFNEWDWAPDLAIGEDCSTLPPPSTMPTARCFIDPCGD